MRNIIFYTRSVDAVYIATDSIPLTAKINLNASALHLNLYMQRKTR
jgi:hypothetical protein